MGQRQQELLKEVTGPQRWFMKTIPVSMFRLSQVSVPQGDRMSPSLEVLSFTNSLSYLY